jgi:phthalate 4,5-cis-dihydrodiol dehydrogenase
VPVSIVYSGYDHFDTDELQDWSTESGRPGEPRHGAARQRLALLERPEHEERSHAMGYGVTVAPPTRQPRFGEVVVSCARADLRITADGLVAYADRGPVPEDIGRADAWSGHHAVIDELVAAVRSDVPAHHDGRFGRETVRVCHALLASARSGRTELLDPEELIA